MNRFLIAKLVSIVLLTALPTAGVAAHQSWHDSVYEGDGYLAEQKLSHAETSYRRALQELQSGVHTNDELVTCLEKLANALALEDKTDEAFKLYERSLALREQMSGKSSPEIVPLLFRLGSIYEAEGDATAAMGLYSRALAINEKNYGPISPAVANSLHIIGRANFKAGKHEEARANYKRSLSILMQQPGLGASKDLEGLLADYSDLLRKTNTSDQDLVSAFQSEFEKRRNATRIAVVPKAGTSQTESAPVPGAPATAEPKSNFQRALDSRVSTIDTHQVSLEQKVVSRGFKEPFSASALTPAYSTMAAVYQTQVPYHEEEERYERMIAIDAKALGPNHPTVADDLYGLVLLYISQNRYAEARPLLIRAIGIYRGVYGAKSNLVQAAESTLATISNKLAGQPIELHVSTNGGPSPLALAPNSVDTARTLNELAYRDFSQGRLLDACTLYQWACSSTEAAMGTDSTFFAATLADYAQVLRSLGRTDDANQVQMRSDSIMEQRKIKTAASSGQ